MGESTTVSGTAVPREEMFKEYERLVKRVDTWMSSSFKDVALLGVVIAVSWRSGSGQPIQRVPVFRSPGGRWHSAGAPVAFSMPISSRRA
jgi:hypothetical protein